MKWRTYFGRDKPLSENEFLEMEIRHADGAKQRILMAGYDPCILENGEYLSALRQALGRNVKVGVVLYRGDSLPDLEKMLTSFPWGEVHKVDARFSCLGNDGFRAYDECFGVSFDRTKFSRYSLERQSAPLRIYREGCDNFFLRLTYNYLQRQCILEAHKQSIQLL